MVRLASRRHCFLIHVILCCTVREAGQNASAWIRRSRLSDEREEGETGMWSELPASCYCRCTLLSFVTATTSYALFPWQNMTSSSKMCSYLSRFPPSRETPLLARSNFLLSTPFHLLPSRPLPPCSPFSQFYPPPLHPSPLMTVGLPLTWVILECTCTSSNSKRHVSSLPCRGVHFCSDH